jgi:hypothetical protein
LAEIHAKENPGSVFPFRLDIIGSAPIDHVLEENMVKGFVLP